jgi:hypothetical protein
MTVNHYLPYLGDDAAPYEAALLDLFQKYPPSSASDVSITIHKAGKAGGDYTSRYPPPGTKSIHEFAELMAHKIVREYKSHVGQVFKGVTLDF